MKAEHKAIIAAAERDGLLPCEKDAQLIVHDMVNATRRQMARFEVGFNKMTEKQQESVLGDLANDYKDTALTIARMLASGATPAVRMTCKDLKISNGTLTGIVASDEQYFNDLISKVQDKSEVMIVLYEREYTQAVDSIQADKDQRALPLDGGGDAPAKGKGKAKAERTATGGAKAAAEIANKAISLTPKLIDDGRAFIIKQQTPFPSSIQNQLKIGYEKAVALLGLYIEEGLVKHIDGDQYEMVRASRQEAASAEQATDAGQQQAEPLSFDGEDDGDGQPITMLTDELYDRIKDKVIADKSFSESALAVAFGLKFGSEVLNQAVDRLELEGVVTEMHELGGRDFIPDEPLNMD